MNSEVARLNNAMINRRVSQIVQEKDQGVGMEELKQTPCFNERLPKTFDVPA